MVFGILNGMNTEISIDKVGRLVLPLSVRRLFHLTAGDRLHLEVMPDGIFLRSRSNQARLVEEEGLLVHEGDPAGDLAQAVELARASRDADVMGLRR
jgi:AbrB family looped-hinge helix DNA binding protein